ncbi:MAG: pentapeptide repeat-containing protein [Acidobacteria bacterium]|nr:pentapeptide repeat-containing protein [Acidobacteriota bacterium]
MTPEPTEFERTVAQVYGELGAQVEHNKNVGGLQIDVFVIQHTPDGSTIRTAIECKAYKEPIGVSIVVEACSRIINLRAAGLIEKGVIVAYSGFTQDARTHCQANLVECFTLLDIQRKIADFSAYLSDLAVGENASFGYRELLTRGTFIPLAAQTEKGEPISSIVDYLENWLDEPGQFLTILGEYGSGKSTTSWHIAQKLASQYLRTKSTRIPILIDLKGFNNNFNLRTFLTDLMLNDKGIKIRSFSLFEKLNKEGKFVIIFDGFDEMTTYPDPAIVFRNLDEILSLAKNKAKVILTCRSSFFKDRTDIERLQTGTDLHSLLHKHKGYQVLFLNGFSEEQVQHYLSRRYGDEWVDYFRELDQRPRLRTLAERPILLHMIVETISNFKSFAAINEVRLYEEYTNIWIKRDDWRCNLTPEQRGDISKVLAFELLRNQVGSIHHKELKGRIATYFEGAITPRTLDQYAHEVRTCTFLKNDMQGFYRFVNLSFAEFLAAKYLLDQIVQGNISLLGESLTHETLYFLSGLINNEKDLYLKYIWDIMRVVSAPETIDHQLNKKIRAVSAYLLLQCKELLSDANLSDVSFPDGANLSGAQIRRTNCLRIKGKSLCLDKVNLSESDFSNCELVGCSFSKAILSGATFIKAELTGADLSSADLRGTDFREAMLRDVVLTPSDVVKALRRDALRRIHKEQSRIRAIKYLGDYIGRIQKASRDSRKQQRNRNVQRSGKRRQGLIYLVNKVLDYDIEDDQDTYLLYVSSFREELTNGFEILKANYEKKLREIENEFDIKMKKAKDLEINSEQSKLGEEPAAVTQLRLKTEQKKRDVRSNIKADREKQEYILRQLKAVVNEIQKYKLIETERKTGKIRAPKVDGALFISSSGLTQHQIDWLDQNHAITRYEGL